MKSRSVIIVLTLILTGLFNRAASQQIKVTESNFDINKGSTSIHKMIGHDQDHFYVIKFHSNQYYLERLDKDLNILREEAIKLYEGLKTYDLETIVHFHDKLYIFVTRRTLSKSILYYQQIDKTNLSPVTEFVELATFDFIKGNWADFEFSLSRKETKLLIVSRIKLLWAGTQFNEFFVFDKDLELQWSHKDSYSYSGPGPRNNYYVVDETGNVSILSLLQRESVFSLLRENRNVYTIYRYTQNGEMFQEYPITLAERYIRGIKIAEGNSGNLVCAGLYSERFKAGMRGTFFFTINPNDGKIYNNYLNEFDDSLLGQLEKLKEPTLQNEELMEYVITDMVLRNNGKIILIAEQIFEQSYNTYNNLIVTCYDDRGQVYWNKVIPKKQGYNLDYIQDEEVDVSWFREYIMETGYFSQGEKNYCSYALMAPIDKNGIIIFYNDNMKNIDNPEKQTSFTRPKKSYLQAVSIDEFGNISSQPLIKWKRRGYSIEPMRFYDTLHDTIVIPGYRYGKYKYYKITAPVD